MSTCENGHVQGKRESDERASSRDVPENQMEIRQWIAYIGNVAPCACACAQRADVHHATLTENKNTCMVMRSVCTFFRVHRVETQNWNQHHALRIGRTANR